MHNRIYQISTSPIKQEDFISENDLTEHPFVSLVADHVDGGTDRVEDVRDFISILGYWESEDYITLTESSSIAFAFLPDAKEKYFSLKYAAFVEARDKTTGMGLSDFASGIAFENALDDMKSAFCYGLGTYMAIKGESEYEIVPLDHFIRHAIIGQRYHIGGTVGYHR